MQPPENLATLNEFGGVSVSLAEQPHSHETRQNSRTLIKQKQAHTGQINDLRR